MTEKPKVKIRVSAAGIPDDLKRLPRWVLWKTDWNAKTQRWAKVPYQPSGKKAASDDPATWSTFEQVFAAMGGYDGVGFVFNGDGITGIDMDKMVDTDGKLSEKAKHILKGVIGYAELSPSGSGLHLITRAEPIGAGKRKDGVEVYSTGRYFTFTGHQINGHTAIPAGNQDIKPFLAEHFGEKPAEVSDLDIAIADQPRTFNQKVNALAMKAFAAWVPALFPQAIPYKQGGYRITSASLDRTLEEDISIVPEGIKDFGVADQEDPRAGKRSPVGLVMEWSEHKTADAAARWLCTQLGANPEAMGAQPIREPTGAAFVPASDFASAQKVEWHIKHIIQKKGLVIVYGDPGSSKSFFVLDMVAHIARGLPWRGHRVKQAKVAYIAAEGVSGFGNRLAAYAKHHDIPLTDLPVFVRGGAMDLKREFLEISQQVIDLGAQVVVIDTLAAVTPGSNENTSEDMGAAIDAAQRIIEATGATVILVHHTNKNGDIRGWSGVGAAVDNKIRIERKDDLRTAHIEKQKEGKDGQAFGYRLAVVHLYDDEDGDAVTSCAVDECAEETPNTRGAKKARKSTGGEFETSEKYSKARHYLSIIEQEVGLGDANIGEADIISAIQADETVNPLCEQGYPKESNIKRTLLTLAEKGKIKREGRWIRLCA